jgi:two-component sensor histidine kinase
MSKTPSRRGVDRVLRKGLLEAILDRPAQFSIWAVDTRFRYIYFNRTHAKLMLEFWGTRIRRGTSVLAYLGDSEYRNMTSDRYRKALSGTTLATETGVTDRTGRYRSFHTLLSPLRGDGRNAVGTGVAAFSIETTELTRRRRELAAAEADKESLLHELDHRVKNNLQTILSILRIQVGSLEDADARKVLQGAMHRVAALGFLYDTSVLSDRVSSISLDGYLHRIVSHFNYEHVDIDAAEAASRTSATTFQTDLEPMPVAMHTAVPLGLITTELLTALRTRAQDEAELQVLLRSDPSREGWAELRVRIGSPSNERPGSRGPEATTARTTPPGEQLLHPASAAVVEALSQQIGGTLRIHAAASADERETCVVGFAPDAPEASLEDACEDA